MFLYIVVVASVFVCSSAVRVTNCHQQMNLRVPEETNPAIHKDNSKS